jgi:hypothetical protein
VKVHDFSWQLVEAQFHENIVILWISCSLTLGIAEKANG